MKEQKQKTLISFILDKSGSMEVCQKATISGFNEYLHSLKKQKGDFLFSLTLFDIEFKKRYLNSPLNKVEKLDEKSYIPDGSTALYDAAVETIESLSDEVDKMEIKPRVLVIIMTDGEENSSRKHDQECFRDLVKKLKTQENWTFTFMGANQDSWLNASKWGFDQGNVVTWSSDNAKGAFAGLASSTMAYANSTDTSSTAFFKDYASTSST